MNNIFLKRVMNNLSKKNAGMELVQVAILIAIAVILGLIFKDKLMDFVNGVFDNLDGANF